MASNTKSKVLWQHPNPRSTQMWQFMESLERATGRSFADYDSMYDYSVNHRSEFWHHMMRYMPIVYSGTMPAQCVDEAAPIDSIPKWFPGLKINYAENILYVGDGNGKATTSPGKEDDKIAVSEVREGSFDEPIRHLTWRELRSRVGRMSQAMRARGVKKGDRIALVAATCVDTLTVFFAACTVGAIFSSSSTDMGVKGIMDRLLQTRPKFLFFDDAAVYNGKKIDLRPKMKEIVDAMTSVHEFEGIISQYRYQGRPADISQIPRCETWDHFLASASSDKLEFEQTEFSDPFLIVYSSGTTGTPKCIVHCIGGVILNGHKENRLYADADHTSTQLQYTTTGWIMFAASMQALLVGCRMVTYDGSPFLPDLTTFLKLTSELKVTHLGISPRYLGTLEAAGIVPSKAVDLKHLQVVSCTGMVLAKAQFQWFYNGAFPSRVHLCNLSGGTDLAAAFATGNPVLPIYDIGGCQSRSLGYAVEVYDQTIEPSTVGGPPPTGKAVEDGVPGELVCPKAFPTMPIAFYGQGGAQKYFNSYFARFKQVWTHGDFIMIDPATKAVLFLGRADGVLNPSGIRFGSAEIYSVIEKHFANEVQDSICVGQRREEDNDERVILFLLMKEGKRMDASLIRNVKNQIGKELSKRHIPKFVFETKEIPTTINLKKVELPVKQIISGKIIKPSSTLANPGSLDYYYRFAKDENLVQLENEPEKLRGKL